jgi:signal transduction histidine kinase
MVHSAPRSKPRTEYPLQAGVQIAERLLVAGLQALERADESDAARRRVAFLFNASQVLAASLEPAATMRALAELVVPELGDGSVVHVVQPTGRPHPFAKASSDAMRSRPVEWWQWLDRVTRPELKRVMQSGAAEVGSTFRKRRPASMRESATVSYMVVPLRARSRTLASLTIFSFAARQQYGREEVIVGEALGTQAGLALENGHLYEEQRRVLERQKLARGRLDAAEDEGLRADERQRIARELHDQVEQTFFAIGLTANTALDPRLGNDSTGPFSDALARTAVLANSGAEQLREAIFALNHAEVAGEGLIPTLFKLVRSFRQRTGIEADLALTGPRRQIPTEIGEALSAVAREALANVERHARAGAVVLRLEARQRFIALTVHDDGAGAPPLLFKQIADSATHFGLRGLRQRVQHLHGTFAAGPGPDGGFVVRVRIPLQVWSQA